MVPYTGGYRLWECAIDVVSYLVGDGASKKTVPLGASTRVLEVSAEIDHVSALSYNQLIMVQWVAILYCRLDVGTAFQASMHLLKVWMQPSGSVPWLPGSH